MPATDLKVVQLGQEVTWGAAVTPTVKLATVTEAFVRPIPLVHQTAELGTLAPSRHVSPMAFNSAAGFSMDVSLEDAPYIFSGLFGGAVITGTNPYTYAWTAPVAAAVIPVIYTAEYGTTGAGFIVSGGIIQTATIRGEAGGPWTASVEMFSKDLTPIPGAFTVLTDRVVEVARMYNTTLLVDAVGGAMGATLFADALRSFELTINTNRHTKMLAGNILPAAWGNAKWEGTLALTLELTADVLGLVNNLTQAVGPLIQRQIRLTYVGVGVPTHRIHLSFAGHITGEPQYFSDADGNITVDLTFQGEYNVAFANWLKVSVINATATLI